MKFSIALRSKNDVIHFWFMQIMYLLASWFPKASRVPSSLPHRLIMAQNSPVLQKNNAQTR